MACHLVALCIDANDPPRLGRFWAEVLGRRLTDAPHDGVVLPSEGETGFAVRFLATRESRSGPNQMHVDLTSTSLRHQQQTVTRALELGARHIDVGQRPEEGHVVLADPEGNEFCVIEPGNRFLAGCTSTWPRWTATSRPRSSGWSPRGRAASTSAWVGADGWP